MSRARNLADLLDANGDVASGALDNVPSSNDASALTTGTLPVARVPYVGRRNLIINGAMQVWQRGTSFSSSGYTADRWSWSGGGAGSISRQSFTVGSEIEDSPYYLRWAITGNSQNLELLQKIEDVRTAAGKTCTLSFWAKSSSNETLGWAVYQNFGSGGSSLTAADGGTYTATTSWQKFTFTFDMPSISGKTIGTNHYVWVRIAQMQTTNTPTLDFAGVQLEVGSVATPFEHRSYGEELALCQRYFQQSSQAGGNPYANRYVPIFKYDSAGYWYGHQEFPVPMRTAPTMTTSLGASGTWGMWWEGTGTSSLTSGLPTCDGSRHGFHFYLNNNVSTVGYGGMTTHGDGSSSYRWEWFADAEL